MLVLGALLLQVRPSAAQGVFVRGDCDQDGEVNITDAIVCLSYLFLGGIKPTCLDACDSDDSEELDITDGIRILDFLFLGGQPSPPPFPEEDLDPSGLRLSCQNGREPPEVLRVVPPELTLYGIGTSQVLLVVATAEPGGDPRDVRLSSSTRYTSRDADVVAVGPDGVVEAVKAGEALVEVRYRGVSVEVPVHVVRGPDDGPRITLQSPVNGSIVTAEEVLLSGSVTDPSAGITLGEAPLENEAGYFQTTVSLDLGVNRLEVVAVGDGGTARDSVEVLRAEPGSPEATGPDGLPLPVLEIQEYPQPDNTAPVVTITSPEPGAVSASGIIDVTGSVDDPTATVRVGGVLAVRADAGWSARVRLPPGEGVITAEAVDPVGNSGRAEVSITIDGTSPRVAITEPPGPVATVGSREVTLRGTVDPPGTPVTVQGVPAAVTDSEWSADVVLDEGLQDVVAATVPDTPPWRQSRTVQAVMVDLAPPRVEIACPPEAALLSPGGFAVSGDSVRFAGRVVDPGVPVRAGGLPSVILGGVAAEIRGGTFVVDVPVEEGLHPLNLVVADQRGNAVSRTLHILRTDAAGPTLTVESGDGESVVAGDPDAVDLVVSALDADGLADTGVEVTYRVVQGDGRFEDGSRVKKAVTGADGRTRAGLVVGQQAGAGSHVVLASAPLRAHSPVAFVVSTVPASSRVLAARGRRLLRGSAGEWLPSPLAVSLLDALGNPLTGEDVTFRVVDGAASLGGAVERTVVTDTVGIAEVRVRLPPEGDSRSTIEASHADAQPVVFRVLVLASGAVADTQLSGTVLDPRGQPLAGVTVRIDEVPGSGGSARQETTTALSGGFRLSGIPSGLLLLSASAPDGMSLGGYPMRVVVIPGRENTLEVPLRMVPLEGPGASGAGTARLRAGSVTPESGALLAPPALPGLTLEVAPGSAAFPDGSRTGRVTICAPNLNVLPVPAPDDILVEVPIAIFPAGVRFDPPARLRAPNLRWSAGARVPVFSVSSGASGFLQLPGGTVEEDGASVLLDASVGVRQGGLFLVSRRGPRGGRTGTLTGRVRVVLPGWQEVPQREASHVLGFNVYAHSGELFVEESDLELPMPDDGLGFTFRRRYESRHNFQGSLGWNWEHEYEDRRLYSSLVPGNVVRSSGRGSFDEYMLDPVEGGFISPIGVFSKLFVDGDGFFVERQPDGTRYRYHPLGGSPLSGRLESITDRNKRRLSFRRNGRGLIDEVRDPLGRLITYRHDAEGRIETVTDFSGRVFTYRYDDAGNLWSVTSPSVTSSPTGNNFPEGKTRRYGYTSGFDDERLNHNLQAIIDPREVLGAGNPRVQIFYEEDPSDPDLDRVIRQVRGGEVSFEYETFGVPRPDLSDADDLERFLLAAAGRTALTDQEGRRTEVTWSGAGLPLSVRIPTREDSRPRDPKRLHPPPGILPPYYETRWTWTREGLLETRVEPRGGRIEHTHNEACPLRYGQGALVGIARYPVPTADGEDGVPVVETLRRDPLFGRVVEESRPGGSTTHRSLDYQEGTDLETLALEAGVDSTDLAAALEEAGISLALGDLNGDGRVSGRGGNVVKEVPPPATLPDGTVEESTVLFTHNSRGQVLTHTDETGRVTTFEYYPEVDPEGDGDINDDPDLDPDTGGFLAGASVRDPEDGAEDSIVLATYRYDPRGYPAGVTDGNGNEEFRVHNELGQLVEVRRPLPLRYRRHWIYDEDDNLVGLRVENFTSTDGGGHFLVSDNRWLDVTIGRDLLGRPETITREVSGGEVGPARSITTEYRYHPTGTLARVIHGTAGSDETWEYDERDLVIRHTIAAETPDAAVFQSYRDEDGNVVIRVEADDTNEDGEPEREERRYDGLGRPTVIIDAAGGVRVLEWDLEDRLLSETVLGSPGGPTPRGSEDRGNGLLARASWVYDERGRLTGRSRVEYSGNALAGSEFEELYLDGSGRPLRVVVPEGEWVRDYDAAGRLRREEGPGGGVKDIDRDGSGNPIRETITTRTRDPVQPEAAGDPDYDGDGRFVTTETIVRVFDPLNRMTALMDTAGGVWRARYDSSSNLIFVSDATGTPIDAGNDPELAPALDLMAPGQRENANAHGNRRRYIHDNVGRLVEARMELRTGGQGGGSIDVRNPHNADGIITEKYEWDDNGRLVAWTDDVGNRTSLGRDGVGYITSKTWPDGTSESHEVDRDGNVRVIVDANGTVLRQSFDVLHRVVRRTIERAAGVEGSTLQRFEYDGLGRLTMAWDNNDPANPTDDAHVLLRHDHRGGTLEELQDGFRVSAARDGSSRVLTLRYPDGRVLVSVRDGIGQLRELRDETGVHATYRHFGSGRLLEKVLRPGVRLSFLRPDSEDILRATPYDAAGAVLEQAYADADGDALHGFEYGRNRAGFKLYERVLHGGGGLPAGRGDAWQYDSAYRVHRYLPGLFDPRVPPDDPVEKLVFYPDGNHSWRLIEENFSLRRLTVNPRSGYETSDGESFTYDAAGSLTGSGALGFIYDGLRRLIRVEREGEVVGVYRYDAVGCQDHREFRGRGRRVSKDVRLAVRGQPEGPIRFVHSGERVIEERDGSGRLLRQYLYGDGRAPEALVVHESGDSPTSFWFLHDAAGSVSGRIDALGAVKERIRYGLHGKPTVYNEFGNPLQFSPVGNPFAFGGLYHDYELGLHRNGSRCFDPQLGRYLTDGASTAPSAPLELNGYLLPGLPGMTGEVTGTGSDRRQASYLDPFRVQLQPSVAWSPSGSVATRALFNKPSDPGSVDPRRCPRCAASLRWHPYGTAGSRRSTSCGCRRDSP